MRSADAVLLPVSHIAPVGQFHGGAGVEAGIGTDAGIKGIRTCTGDHSAVVSAEGKRYL